VPQQIMASASRQPHRVALIGHSFACLRDGQ